VQFVEDEGDVVFYKNAHGKAACKAVYNEPVSDSGVDVLDSWNASWWIVGLGRGGVEIELMRGHSSSRGLATE
jgi:hypothetical protein